MSDVCVLCVGLALPRSAALAGALSQSHTAILPYFVWQYEVQYGVAVRSTVQKHTAVSANLAN